ncbi:MAG: hypothetical protein ACRECY_03145 [Phyllobacterium sp.]
MTRPILERVAMQGSSRSASSGRTILISPDAACTGAMPVPNASTELSKTPSKCEVFMSFSSLWVRLVRRLLFISRRRFGYAV